MKAAERTGRSIIVRVLKYAGSEYRLWNARISRCEGSLIVLEAEFEDDVQHNLLGDIRRGTRTIEYYWLDRWYNVFRFLDDDGSTSLYYCNVNTPPKLEDAALSYIDLDIDIVVQPDLSFQVLDLDEFEVNSRRYDYSDDVKCNALSALKELTVIIETHQFPFFEASSSSVSTLVNQNS